MWTWLKSIFGIVETDLNKILAGFNKTIADLDAHAQHHVEQAGIKDDRAQVLLNESAVHSEQADKADAVRAKLSALITS